MPELPEVETVVRDLRPRLLGLRIASVQTSGLKLRRDWSDAWTAALTGRHVREVRRRGKWILTVLDTDLHLVFHLGMSGQLTVATAQEPAQPHTHLTFALDRGADQLRFRDIRRFGSATLYTSAAAVQRAFEEANLGPEPFDLDPAYWRQRLAATERCLKAVLLDQTIVAGVGNIYADESLFTARLHPGRAANTLTAAEARRLREAIPAVLNRAIAKRGSSIRNYVGGSGRRGEYQEELLAYGRTGRPCSRCGRAIERTRLAGRSTHFCPHCQKESRRSEPEV
ncbi:MAG: bifunctional DNA-formamidopyrimidine glycosylase/DNA-(apurinic or apyrimidinic site) lyase [Gemmataceae bacterium]|nr:bifunctional DNA-formamidopyrimidine glycosylase/DNA-(apurinic or apyrimidinic site) lyase [Gemmataceae bacterium]